MRLPAALATIAITAAALSVPWQGLAKRPNLTSVTFANAIAPLKISSCLMNRQNRCIDNRIIPYTFSKQDFTNFANGLTVRPPAASITQNRICSPVTDARGRTVTQGGAVAQRCKLSPPLPPPPRPTVRLSVDTASGSPTCLSPWFAANATNADATVRFKRTFWNGMQPGCGSPHENDPVVDEIAERVPAGRRVQLGCTVVPVDAHHSCSWHLRFACKKGTGSDCEIE